jgi:hypothetical protein
VNARVPNGGSVVVVGGAVVVVVAVRWREGCRAG